MRKVIKMEIGVGWNRDFGYRRESDSALWKSGAMVNMPIQCTCIFNDSCIIGLHCFFNILLLTL